MSTSDFTPLAETGHPRRRVKFDPTINLGHVMTFFGFLVAGFGAYSTLSNRLTVLEMQAVAVVDRSREQDARLKDSLVELKKDIKDLQQSVNDVNRTLSAQKAQP
mgnify:CR=1 FL=1